MIRKVFAIVYTHIVPAALRLCAVVVMSGGLSNACYSDEMNITALGGLDIDSQRLVIQNAIERRRHKLSNIALTSNTTTQGYEWRDGSRGKSTNPGVQSSCVLKRLDGSYRLSAKLFKGVSAPELIITSESNFLGEIGESRILGDHKGADRQYGRIDIKRDNTEAANPAAYYLAEGFDLSGTAFWPVMLDRLSDWSVDVIATNNQVVIAFPHIDSSISEGELVGLRTIVLDWGRDASIVGDSLKWKLKRGDREDWWDTAVTLEKPVQVGDTSVPTRIIALKRSSALGDEQCVEEVTEVSDISLGSVNKADLQVDFPPGTYVTNVVEKVAYTVGKDGRPKGEPEVLYEVDAMKATSIESEAGHNVWLWFNVLLVVGLVVAVVLRRRLG